MHQNQSDLINQLKELISENDRIIRDVSYWLIQLEEYQISLQLKVVALEQSVPSFLEADLNQLIDALAKPPET